MPYRFIKKIDGSVKYPEKSSTTKIGENILRRYSMSAIWAFDHTENKPSLYCGGNCMKKVCTPVREHATSITDFEKKKILPLTKKTKITLRCNSMLYLWGKNI